MCGQTRSAFEEQGGGLTPKPRQRRETPEVSALLEPREEGWPRAGLAGGCHQHPHEDPIPKHAWKREETGAQEALRTGRATSPWQLVCVHPGGPSVPSHSPHALHPGHTPTGPRSGCSG